MVNAGTRNPCCCKCSNSRPRRLHGTPAGVPWPLNILGLTAGRNAGSFVVRGPVREPRDKYIDPLCLIRDIASEGPYWGGDDCIAPDGLTLGKSKHTDTRLRGR